MKQKSEHLKPANHQSFTPPASHPSARAQPPPHQGQSASSNKSTSQILQKRVKNCFGALIVNEQGALKHRNNSVLHKHTEIPQSDIKAASPGAGSVRCPLPRSVAGRCGASWSHRPLCQAPHTAGCLSLACPCSFLTLRRNGSKNGSLWKFQPP